MMDSCCEFDDSGDQGGPAVTRGASHCRFFGWALRPV